MAKKDAKKDQTASKAKESLPTTIHTGVNAKETKTVIISALLDVTGQLRFGDGTDIATTITEKDIVSGPNGNIEKAIWAGTKRRGVDRRTIHEFRDRMGWNKGDCYIPELCGLCPTCWLYGFTGTTQEKTSPVKGINAKSRVLYSTSLSMQETSRCLNRHSRNQVDEKMQTTAGTAGIHEEEVIVAGTHFPVHTSLIHVLDWEIGVVAHALLENLNTNRYTAASRGQGGLRVLEQDSEPLIIVDESPTGVFPIAAPKVPAWMTNSNDATKLFATEKKSPVSLLRLEEMFQSQGFAVESKASGKFIAKSGILELTIEAQTGCVVVQQGPDEIMKRHYGNQAIGYLRQRQMEAQKQFGNSTWRDEFTNEVKNYAERLTKAKKKEEAGGTADDSVQAPQEVDDSGGQA